MVNAKMFSLNDYFNLSPEIVDAILEYGEKRFIKELIKEGIVKGMELCNGWGEVQDKAFEVLEDAKGIILEDLSKFFDIDAYIGFLIQEGVFELKYFAEDYPKKEYAKTYLWIERDLFEYDEERLEKKVKEKVLKVLLEKFFDILIESLKED